MNKGAAVQSVSFPSQNERKAMGTAGPDHQETNSQFPMSPGDWERAKAILTLVADLPEKERTHFLETHLSNDPTLSTTVLTLLETYDKTSPGVRPTPSVEQHEDRIHSGGSVR